MTISDLPAANASLNFVSTVFISSGWYLIRRGHWRRHVACMITAVISSTLFLIGYVTYHVHLGEALRLLELRCQESKLVDKAGRETYFFHLIGCWGNPPVDYEERLALQAQEIQRLKKQYTVLEIPCAQRDPRLIQ